jgi:hypothetical protein
VLPAPVEVCGQAEVQQHHAPLPGDQHVARLDVPVQLARLVQGMHPGRQLPQAVAQAPELRGRQTRRREGRLRRLIPSPWGHQVRGVECARRANGGTYVGQERGPLHQLHGEEL